MTHSHDHAHDAAAGGKLRFAIALTAAVLVAEVAGGIYTHSLALLSDAAHVFMDVFSLALSLLALRLALRPATDTRTYGLHRTEVFAAFINGVTLFIIAIGIYREAWQRLRAPVAIKSGTMMAIALIGMLANLVVVLKLMGHGGRDLNIRSAFLHVLGDFLASIGVVLGGATIFLTGWYVVDPILSAAIATLIFLGSGRVIRESVHILLEGVPRGIQINDVAATIRAIPGVRDIHHLHVWNICSNILAISSHVVVDDERIASRDHLLQEIEHALEHEYGITHSTLQFDTITTGEEPLLKDLRHPAPPGHSDEDHHHDDPDPGAPR